MGLAAGQARLLTITARKSDCEYQSMRLSHQKIALSRELADLSNEYQNSLDQTKLVYDYYGTGDTSTPLSYGILMTPSTLNDFMPTILTDSLGRVTLNSKYASAARFAGIPQEGLGTLPSDSMRNAFVLGLYNSGLINSTIKDTIIGLPYNQEAGFGGDVTVAVQTKDVTVKELADILDSYAVNPTDSNYDSTITRGVVLYDNNAKTYYKNGESNIVTDTTMGPFNIPGPSNYTEMASGQVTLGDILSGDYTLIAPGAGNRTSSIGYSGGAIDAVVTSTVWGDMLDAMESLLDTGDAYTQQALEYARSQIDYMISNQCNQEGRQSPKGDDNAEDGKYQFFNDNDMENFAHHYHSNKDNNTGVINQVNKWVSSSSSGYIGLVARGNADSGHDDKNGCASAVAVNISSVMKAYLTYFYDFMNGISATDIDGNDAYYVGDKLSTSSLVDDNTVLTITTGTSVSSDELAQATFYDALFNQICANGWTENDNIEDTEYLQEMLQNGMLFISKAKDDGYYYQGNYATDTYIKEVTDDTMVAQAEAKYSTEKAKLNAKEETLDMKMKNLDTEISSLTTEYDTVKNTISKNIEKSFKRYNA